jgi:hypothetical protein
VSLELEHKTAQQPATRADLAHQLLARVDRLAPRLGDVSLAAEIQLLKRELLRGHAILSAGPEDNNYLSVVTLVEGVLTSLTWKGYTPGVLDAIRRAFAAGVGEGEFSFAAYDAIRQDFRTLGILSGPTIDPTLPAPEAEDEDGPQA